jgi:hypothetical protein
VARDEEREDAGRGRRGIGEEVLVALLGGLSACVDDDAGASDAGWEWLPALRHSGATALEGVGVSDGEGA